MTMQKKVFYLVNAKNDSSLACYDSYQRNVPRHPCLCYYIDKESCRTNVGKVKNITFALLLPKGATFLKLER